MKVIKLTLSVLLIFLLAACGRVQPVLNVENTPVAYNLQSDQIKLAITQAALQRGWVIQEIEPGLLDAKLVCVTISLKFIFLITKNTTQFFTLGQKT